MLQQFGEAPGVVGLGELRHGGRPADTFALEQRTIGVIERLCFCGDGLECGLRGGAFGGEIGHRGGEINSGKLLQALVAVLGKEFPGELLQVVFDIPTAALIEAAQDEIDEKPLHLRVASAQGDE